MPELTRRQVALVIAGVLAALTLGVGIYGLVTGPARNHPGTGPVPRHTLAADTTPAGGQAQRDPSLVALPRSNDPVLYARAVASAIFNWNTSDGYMPGDYEAPVLGDADPSGDETPGLIEDLSTYLPTIPQWLNLATMNVSQTLKVASAAIPADWQSITANAHGQLRPGTVAVTITGTRVRNGIWDGQPARTSSPVAFTIFVACRPAFDRCQVLRLSALETPLR